MQNHSQCPLFCLHVNTVHTYALHCTLRKEVPVCRWVFFCWTCSYERCGAPSGIHAILGLREKHLATTYLHLLQLDSVPNNWKEDASFYLQLRSFSLEFVVFTYAEVALSKKDRNPISGRANRNQKDQTGFHPKQRRPHRISTVSKERPSQFTVNDKDQPPSQKT